MLELATANNVKAIALPAIGAGLGGLLWEEVKGMIEKVSSQYPSVDLYVIESYAPSVTYPCNETNLYICA